MKIALIIVSVLVLAVLAALGHDLLLKPASWQNIHMGDLAADVKTKYPNLDDGMHATKSVDVLVEREFTGHWVTFLVYDQSDKVAGKELEFRLGTLRHFVILDTLDESK